MLKCYDNLHGVVIVAEQVAEVGSNFLVGSSVVAVAVVGSPEHLVEYLGNHRRLKNIDLNCMEKELG